MNVYTRVPRSEHARTGGKLIWMAWVDINTGDRSSPNYRAPLVGHEFKTEVDTSLCSGTPPLETLKYPLSIAATEEYDGQARTHLPVNGISRA